MNRRRWLAAGGAILAIVMVLAVVLRLAFPSLPFHGPRQGVVTDATTGRPIAGAKVEAVWWCHDNPLPDGPGHRFVRTSATTNAAGRFSLAPPAAAGGRFGSDYHVEVTAAGYIDAVFIEDPNNVPLPAQTAAWPFKDTRVVQAMPETLDVKLRPARPVLERAAESPNELIRETAMKMLKQLDAATPAR